MQAIPVQFYFEYSEAIELTCDAPWDDWAVKGLMRYKPSIGEWVAWPDFISDEDEKMVYEWFNGKVERKSVFQVKAIWHMGNSEHDHYIVIDLDITPNILEEVIKK